LTVAGLRLKHCVAGAGLDGLRGGLEVCGAGAGKIDQTPAGAERGGFKFSGCGTGADTKFQPAQDSGRSPMHCR